MADVEGEGTSGEPIPKGEKPEELVAVDKFVEVGVVNDVEILLEVVFAYVDDLGDVV